MNMGSREAWLSGKVRITVSVHVLGTYAGTGHSGISGWDGQQCLGVRNKEWKWPLWELAPGQYLQVKGGCDLKQIPWARKS